MPNRTFASVMLVLAFTLLWVPLGQHSFLVTHWMKVGALIAPFLLLTAAAFRSQTQGSILHDLRILSALMLAAYILHQVEEHWIDLTGKTYAFHGYVNALLRNAVGAPEETELLTRQAIFVINTSLVWLVGTLAVLLSPPRVFPALCMAAIILINSISHIIAAIGTGAYNPGVATAVFPFIPIALWTFWVARRGAGDLIFASLLWAVLSHVVMVGGVIGAMWLQLYPEPAYFALLVAMSILPALLFTRRSAKTS
ncbi:MAG: HXXEE domain-containing protein [Pseudomonadota bacterium]